MHLLLRGCFFDEIERAPKCAVCSTSKTKKWRTPGTQLLLCQRYVSSQQATRQSLREGGGISGGDTSLCNICWLDAYRNAPVMFQRDQSTMEGYLN